MDMKLSVIVTTPSLMMEMTGMTALVVLLKNIVLVGNNIMWFQLVQICNFLVTGFPLFEEWHCRVPWAGEVIQKSKTECYECQPKSHQKTFYGCTIRNTPSEPIHCIVWTKYLFNQLFGEADPDEDVSPDT